MCVVCHHVRLNKILLCIIQETKTHAHFLNLVDISQIYYYFHLAHFVNGLLLI